MKKNKLFSFVEFFFFLVLLIVILLRLSNILEEKTSNYNRKPIFEQNTPIDVLIIGSSHAKDGISPYYLWKDYGISSYNFASSGEKIQLTYFTLKDVITKVKPKIVILDAYLSSGDTTELSMDYGLAHESIDYMNLDADKIKVSNLLSKGCDTNCLSFLSNIYAYHYRWKELGKEDYIVEFSPEKGGKLLFGGKPFDGIPEIEGVIDDKVKESAGYEYLNKIMDLCKENDSDFLLVNIPFINQSEKTVNCQYTFMDCVNSRGYKSIFYPELVRGGEINPNTDYYDMGHLNIIGAKKVSDYLGNYLLLNTSIEDHRDSEEYASWNEFVSLFEESRVASAEDATDAYEFAISFWDSERYKVEFITQQGKIGDKILNDYIKQNQIDVCCYNELDEYKRELVDNVLVEDVFTDNTMVAFIYDLRTDDIVLRKKFLFYPDGYR